MSEQPPSDPQAAVLVLTAWHLSRMSSMPRAFWRVRTLERATHRVAGCLWIHRWISRRSLLLTSAWESDAAAEAWLASDGFASVDASLKALPGTETRLERMRPA